MAEAGDAEIKLKRELGPPSALEERGGESHRADEALARAEANFAAARELCRTGHRDTAGATTCTYGGMSSAGGYWLASEGCDRGHGEVCDLRAVCDGDGAVTGFRGSAPDPEIMYWVWRVSACQPCADLYVAAHPTEWGRPDPDEPTPTYDEIMARLHEEVEAQRAAMGDAEREASDMVMNMLLYGRHPAPDEPPRFTGLAGLFGDPVALEPAVTPVRNEPAPKPPTDGLLSAETLDRALQERWNATPYRMPPRPGPVAAGTATGLFAALGGVIPGSRGRRPGADGRLFDRMIRADEQGNGPLPRARWAPSDCVCPWPWPMGGSHVRLDCPGYVAPAKPIVGRNPYTECRRVDGTWVHGCPHSCPKWMRAKNPQEAP